MAESAAAKLGRLDFVVLRGGTADERPEAEKPYSAASYAAQYGIPLDDAEGLIGHCATHGEIRHRIYREYLCDAEFRKESLSAGVRELTEEETREAEVFLKNRGKTNRGPGSGDAR